MAYAFIRRIKNNVFDTVSLRNVNRLSVWISDKVAQVNGEELENLLVVHVWLEDGTKKIYDDCIDVEML